MGLLQNLQIGLVPTWVRTVLQRMCNVGKAGSVHRLVPAGGFLGQRPQQLLVKLPPLTAVQAGEIRRMKRLKRQLLSPGDAAPQQLVNQPFSPPLRRRLRNVPPGLALGDRYGDRPGDNQAKPEDRWKTENRR